jgi:methionyl-tRNA formyltransferase
MNIVFAGTPDFACPTLAALLASEHSIVAVYTQPDRPAGRGRKLQPSPVKVMAEAAGIPVFQPASLRDPTEIEMLKALHPDVMVVAAYGLLLPEAVLNVPTHGCLNVHASLLPRWRGAAPVQHALLHGDKETGVTIMQMEKGLDTGPMLHKASCEITTADNAGTLTQTLADLGAQAMLDVLSDLSQMQASASVQDDSLATHAGKIVKADAQLDWQLPANTLVKIVRAYNPWPMAFTFLGEQRIRIAQASVVPLNESVTPGTIIQISCDGIDVATRQYLLRIKQCQLPGGKMLAVADLLQAASKPFVQGQIFSAKEKIA